MVMESMVSASPSYFYIVIFFSLTLSSLPDTAAHRGPTFDEGSGIQTCWQRMHPPLETCPDNLRGVDAGFDPVDNLMNYLPGVCYEYFGRFTPGQVERMVAEYEMYRYQPQSCQFSRCETQSDCCGDRSMRCIYKRRRSGSFCLRCRALGSRCTQSSDCCPGLTCDAGQTCMITSAIRDALTRGGF